jgi:hypothetical protein
MFLIISKTGDEGDGDAKDFQEIKNKRMGVGAACDGGACSAVRRGGLAVHAADQRPGGTVLHHIFPSRYGWGRGYGRAGAQHAQTGEVRGIFGGDAVDDSGRGARRRDGYEGGWASTLADLDGDGDPDALVYDGSRIIVGINQGGKQGGAGGVFKRFVDVPVADPGYGDYGVLLTGDIDGDTRVDALLLGRGHSFGRDEQPFPDNFSWTWLNKVKANGLFETETSEVEALKGLSIAGAALGDVDGDGDLDLAAAVSPSAVDTMSGSSLVVVLNDGQGSFSNSGLRLSAPESTSIALGDVDGDGHLDALVGTGGGAVIYTNQGAAAGTLEAAETGIPGGKTRSVHLADMDNDGDLDALVAGGRQARLWWNDREGRFSQAEQSFPCSERQGVTVADFNGDGWLDIFVGQYDKRAWVWVNVGEGRFKLSK